MHNENILEKKPLCVLMAYYNLLNLFLELKNKIKCQIEATANQDNLTREIKKQNNQEMEFNFWENGIVKEER